MGRFVGLDIHKKVVQAAIQNAKGKEVSQTRFGCSRGELEQYARQHLRRTDRVALEATTNTWAVVDIIKPYVKEVVVSNPLRTKAIASAKVKTDKVDARVLAHLLRCDYLPRVWEPPEEIREARSITGRRARLVADRTTVKNRVQAALRQRLIQSPGRRLFSPKGREWLAKLDLDPSVRLAVESDLRIIEAIDKEIELVDATLLRESGSNDDVKLLVTLPGVDVSVAQTLHAALGDVQRFPDGDRAASYLGLAPSTRQSADHCTHGPITKQGNTQARWLLVQAAKHAANNPGPLGAFFRRVAKKRGANIAAVATARKMVVIAWYMLKRREPYRYALPVATQAKLRRIRTAAGVDRRKGPRRAPAAAPAKRRPANSRRIPPLSEVYATEGLPKTAKLSGGENRMLRTQRLVRVIDALNKENWKPRAKKRNSEDEAERGA